MSTEHPPVTPSAKHRPAAWNRLSMNPSFEVLIVVLGATVIAVLAFFVASVVVV